MMDSFSWPVDFSCTIVDDDIIVPNHYTLNFFIEPAYPVSNDSMALGIKKIKHLVYGFLDQSILINQDNPLVPALETAKTNLVKLPCEPYDFFVGSVLYLKFVAITQEYFDILHLTIDSHVGERVQYGILDPNDCGLELKGDFWWNQDNASTGSSNATSWEELNLISSPRFQPTVVQGGLRGNQ